MRNASLPQVMGALMLPIVAHIKSFVAILLLLAWLPCTAHCQIESLGLFGSKADCCERSESGSDGPSDCHECAICQSVESGGYFVVKQPVLTSIIFAVVADFLANELRDTAAIRPALATDGDSQPVFLATSWQFDLRASAPPRAPSFAS